VGRQSANRCDGHAAATIVPSDQSHCEAFDFLDNSASPRSGYPCIAAFIAPEISAQITTGIGTNYNPDDLVEALLLQPFEFQAD